MWSFFSRDPASSFPYEIGEKIEGLEDKSVWSVHHGKKKADGHPVSIFVLDAKNSSSAAIERGKTAHKRLKTIRHPNFLQYLDGLETDTIIYAVTEQVIPLQTYLNDSSPNEQAISWGLHQVVKGLSFLHNDCKLKHNNVNMSSVFVSKAGEWKVGGVAYVGPAEGEGSEPPNKGMQALEKYNPPEMSDARTRKKTHTWSADMWGLGCLIWEIFNGSLPRTSSLKALGKIPKSLVANYCELVGANPLSRPNPAKFIDSCRADGGFLHNSFVDTNLFLEEIQIKEQLEKNKFFASLSTTIDEFPQEFCRYRILPLLLEAFQFGGAGSAVLTPLLKLGKLLEPDEYQKKIVPCVVKMFSSTDRATRVKLLQQMEYFVEHLQPPVVNDQIFPHICHGFSDTNPVIREHTVKAMLLLASKLNDKNLNGELLKHFAKTQAKDEQGGIRTNTTICLGKIACYLNPATRQKVLSSAFVRAMKDPFPPARTAGIMSMLATKNYYSIRDTAFKVLPVLCTLTVDPDKGVRDQTFKAIGVFLQRLQTVSDNPEKAAEMEAEVNAAASTAQGASSSWTGWAVTSLTSRFYRPGATANQTGAKAGGPSTTAPTAAAQKPPVTAAKAADPVKPHDTRQDAEEAARDSASDYEDTGGEGGGDGWDENEEWGDIDSFSTSSSKTAASRDSYQDPSSTRAETQELGWDTGSWGDSDDVADPPQRPPGASKKHGQAKPGQSRTGGGMKLAAKKQTSPSFDDWGVMEDDEWGSINSSSSVSSKPVRTSANPRTTKSSPKKDKSHLRTEPAAGGWDDGDWGTMDGGGAKMDAKEEQGGAMEGWGGATEEWGGDDDWGSLEDSTPAPASRLQADNKPQGAKTTPAPPGWGDSLDFAKDTSHAPASSYNWGDEPDTGDFFSSALKKPSTQKPKSTASAAHSKKPAMAARKGQASSQPATVSSGWEGDDGWGETGDDWGSFGNDSGMSKAEEAKRKREEKRLQREREMKEKRAAKKPGMGAMRLGAKKE
ncbi:N-terminal kinase-like protein [Patiria miniata]|uniref:N-terminal kinase-like protein n=1 Tax=Patiria miniata TaxID=46514 RepID=A0A914B9M7_PATMI|nr:N-terminal kinase-like protein [Patiria miniata]